MQFLCKSTPTLKMTICCFSLGGTLDFRDFLQKKFYNIDYRKDAQGEHGNGGINVVSRTR